MMWLLFAFLSALFAGLTAILAKCGIENMDSNVATAIRTIVVLIFSWVLVFVMGVQNGIFHLSGKTITFLVLSGVATGASWLCYFHALQIGDDSCVLIFGGDGWSGSNLCNGFDGSRNVSDDSKEGSRNR